MGAGLFSFRLPKLRLNAAFPMGRQLHPPPADRFGQSDLLDRPSAPLCELLFVRAALNVMLRPRDHIAIGKQLVLLMRHLPALVNVARHDRVRVRHDRRPPGDTQHALRHLSAKLPVVVVEQERPHPAPVRPHKHEPDKAVVPAVQDRGAVPLQFVNQPFKQIDLLVRADRRFVVAVAHQDQAFPVRFQLLRRVHDYGLQVGRVDVLGTQEGFGAPPIVARCHHIEEIPEDEHARALLLGFFHVPKEQVALTGRAIEMDVRGEQEQRRVLD